MELKKELVLRDIAGDFVLIPTGTTVLENNGLFTINEVAARIWELLHGAESAAALTDALAEEYDADRDTLDRDVAEFLDKLRSLGIL